MNVARYVEQIKALEEIAHSSPVQDNIDVQELVTQAYERLTDVLGEELAAAALKGYES